MGARDPGSPGHGTWWQEGGGGGPIQRQAGVHFGRHCLHGVYYAHRQNKTERLSAPAPADRQGRNAAALVSWCVELVPCTLSIEASLLIFTFLKLKCVPAHAGVRVCGGGRVCTHASQV